MIRPRRGRLPRRGARQRPESAGEVGRAPAASAEEGEILRRRKASEVPTDRLRLQLAQPDAPVFSGCSGVLPRGRGGGQEALARARVREWRRGSLRNDMFCLPCSLSPSALFSSSFCCGPPPPRSLPPLSPPPPFLMEMLFSLCADTHSPPSPLRTKCNSKKM